MACGWRMVYTMLFSAEQNQSQPKPKVVPQGKAPHNDWAVMAFIEHWHNWAQVLLLSLIGNDPLHPSDSCKRGTQTGQQKGKVVCWFGVFVKHFVACMLQLFQD